MLVKQGTLVALVGPKGQGKSTLLRLIGSVILPECGDGFFTPSHLRVLHVSDEPVFFLGTLYDNLTFGVSHGDTDRSMERVLKICDRLKISQELLDTIRNEVEGKSDQV